MEQKVFRTQKELAGALGRSRLTVINLRKKRCDLHGDPFFTGRFVEAGKFVEYHTTEEAFEALRELLKIDEAIWSQVTSHGRGRYIPPYIKNASGKGRGSEEVTADDLLTTEVRGRDGSGYHLWLKNREWLHVFAEDGCQSRLHIDDVDGATIAGDRFWPFADALEMWAGRV